MSFTERLDAAGKTVDKFMRIWELPIILGIGVAAAVAGTIDHYSNSDDKTGSSESSPAASTPGSDAEVQATTSDVHSQVMEYVDNTTTHQ